MTTSFEGFGPGLYEFFEGLAVHNDRGWFAEHKVQYETEVRAPLEDLLDALEPEFGAARLFRLHRDVRFSKDKSPYKTQQGGLIDMGTGCTRYLHVDAAGIMLGTGAPHLDRDQLARFRDAVAGSPGEELGDVVRGLRRRRFDVGTLGPGGITPEGDLQRVPRGYPADHPRADLLRCKSLIAAVSFERPTWLESGRAVAEVTRRWRAMQPLADWIGAHVGAASPSEDRPRGGRR